MSIAPVDMMSGKIRRSCNKVMNMTVSFQVKQTIAIHELEDGNGRFIVILHGEPYTFDNIKQVLKFIENNME